MELENQFSINNLDDHLLLEILQYLNLKEATNLLFLSKRLANLFKQDGLYKSLSIANLFEGKYIVDVKPEDVNYKHYFLENIERVKRYRNILDHIISIQGTQNYFSNIQSQKAYSTDSKKLKEILSIVEKNYQKIPKNLLILYRILNGQKELQEAINNQLLEYGLFGMMQYYHTIFSMFFNQFSTPPCGFLENFKAHPFSSIRPGSKTMYMDVTNMLGFGYESIYIFSPFRRDQNSLFININHSSVDSFMDKMSRFNWKEDKDDIDYLDAFDTLYQPGSDATTNGIRIRATAKHVTMDQNNGINENFYSYSIRISAHNMPEGKRFKLKSRKWIITKDIEPNDQESVVGEGVIGLYPEIYSGCPDFLYQSCTVMEGYTGKMEGFFTFIEKTTKEQVDARIDPFPLRPDSDSKLICYNLTTKQSEVIYG